MELKRIDIAGTTLIWGDAAQAKAELREESERKFRELPLAKRLEAALALIRRNRERPSGGR